MGDSDYAYAHIALIGRKHLLRPHQPTSEAAEAASLPKLLANLFRQGDPFGRLRSRLRCFASVVPGQCEERRCAASALLKGLARDFPAIIKVVSGEQI